jgi:DNA replication protein DnaC
MTRTRRGPMTEKAADASIEQACRILRLPTIRDRFGDQVAAAARQQATYQSFLSELLFIECEDREVRRKAHLVKQAGFPRTKRIEDFDFAANPNVPPALVHTLAKGAISSSTGAALMFQVVTEREERSSIETGPESFRLRTTKRRRVSRAS